MRIVQRQEKGVKGERKVPEQREEMVSKGLAKFANYEGRKALIYQDQLLKAQEEAKSKKLGVWK